MKNLTIFFFSLLFFSNNISAQELKYNKQYGLNGSTLLSGFIDLPSSPYQLSIKTYGETVNKRLQIGVQLGSSLILSEPSFSGGFGVQFRNGKERFEDFGKNDKWRVFYGVDGVFSFSFNVFGDNIRAQIGAGFAPFAGIQYRINDRISIYTEASYQTVLSVLPASGDVGIAINGNFLPPAALWVGFDLYKEKKEEIENNN